MHRYHTYEADVIIETEDGLYAYEGSHQADELFESSPLYLESIRFMLGDEDEVLSDEQVWLILEEAERTMSAAEFKFLKKAAQKVGRGLKKFGKKAVKFGKKALPVVGRLAQIAAPIVGTIIGGPAGAKIGGMVSQGIGALMGGGNPMPPTRPPSPFTPPILPQNTQLAGVTQLLSNRQPAANQLLGLLQNPALIQSVLGQILGGRGGGTVKLNTPNMGGRSNIPFGAIMNLLGQLSTQAAIDASEYVEDEPTYLYDQYGEFMIDNPASSEDRAALVREMLYEHTLHNYALPTEHTEGYDSMTEWFLRAKLIN